MILQCRVAAKIKNTDVLSTKRTMVAPSVYHHVKVNKNVLKTKNS